MYKEVLVYLENINVRINFGKFLMIPILTHLRFDLKNTTEQ